MNIIKDNPIKRKWKVYAYSFGEGVPTYSKEPPRPSDPTPMFERNNFIFEARLEFYHIYNSYNGSVWVSLMDLDDKGTLNMRLADFNNTMKNVKAGKIALNGTVFFGRFTFLAMSGSLYIEPYLID